MKQKVAQGNQIRGLLAEYGIIIAKGLSQLENLPSILENDENKLSVVSKEIFFQMYEQLKSFVSEVSYYDKKINMHAATEPRYIAVQDIEDIGPITASAIVATIGDPDIFTGECYQKALSHEVQVA